MFVFFGLLHGHSIVGYIIKKFLQGTPPPPPPNQINLQTPAQYDISFIEKNIFM